MGKPPKLYSENVAKDIGSKLDHLAQNPKGLQVKELVFQLRSKIEAAQASGHTLEDIVGVFKAQGVDLTLNTLKQYLRESRSLSPDSGQHSLPGTASKPASKPSKSKSSETTVSPKPQPEPEPEPEPDQSKPGKPSKAETESKSQLTNTNEDGFQEMRSNDDL
jgi:hypothetical protein